LHLQNERRSQMHDPGDRLWPIRHAHGERQLGGGEGIAETLGEFCGIFRC